MHFSTTPGPSRIQIKFYLRFVNWLEIRLLMRSNTWTSSQVIVLNTKEAELFLRWCWSRRLYLRWPKKWNFQVEIFDINFYQPEKKIPNDDDSSSFPRRSAVIRFSDAHTESSFQFRFHIICVTRFFQRRGMYTESFTFRSSLSREGVACARARSFQNSQEKRNAYTRNSKERVKFQEIQDKLRFDGKS